MESVAHLNKLIQERHGQMLKALDDLLVAIASAQMPTIKNANDELDRSIDRLMDALAVEDQPAWLRAFKNKTHLYKHNHRNGPATWKAHLLAIIQWYEVAKNHVWFSDSQNPSIDFDFLIKNASNAHRLDETYENLIECLQRILESGEIDSRKAHADLERLLNILKSAKDKGFAAKFGSWKFVRLFATNILKEYAGESKTIGPMIRAFVKTQEELDDAFDKTSSQITAEIYSVGGQGFQTHSAQALGQTNFPQLAPPSENDDENE